MKVVPDVDIDRFMGDWYVIANIPTFFERDAYNPIERYSLNPDGTVETRFIFNDKTASGPERTMKAKGFVDEDNPAQWGMQFIWPIKADYRIVYLDDRYQHTIIARQKRDYLWIMSRQPGISDNLLEDLIQFAVDLGYDRDKIKLSSWQLNARDQDYQASLYKERKAG